MNKPLRVICESQQGPTGRWLSSLAKSGPPLTCLPATSCLLVTLSPPPWRAVRLLSRWEAHEALWMSDRGPSPARTHHPACLVPYLPILLTPPLDPHPAAEKTAIDGSWQPVWLPACLTACGYAKCTDFHILKLRSGVIWKHATRDCSGYVQACANIFSLYTRHV